MDRVWFVPRLVLAALPLALFSCDRKEEPAPLPASSGTRQPIAKPASSGIPIPEDTSALPQASRDPDWGLDPSDPAKDYVSRYLRATKRYGEHSACVVVRPSTFAGGRSVVETRNDGSGTCGKADDLRDRFFVVVATDTMSLDDSLHQPKLRAWPDGSDTDGPPKRVTDIQDLHTWKAALRDTFHKLQLAPLRVQLYGRGTYPVVSIAGWHGPVQRTMTSADLEAPAKALCDANDGEPLGILAGVDRTTLLQISCAGGAHARFESL
jgi:hypothetical protein